MLEHIREARDYIQLKINIEPEIGLILGSGLGVLADQIENQTVIPYEEIPHFPKSTVEGHKGQLVIGHLAGRNVLAMQGRFHYYEGYQLEQVVFPVRVMHELGVHSLILTNAAGGINETFNPGDLMIISDHINNLGGNPLIGTNINELGPRFPDMSAVYDRAYIRHAKSCAEELGLKVQTGVYVANTGPAYETPAEVRMLRLLGGDAVGMSTVPEAITARHMDMRVLGISCITNMTAGILDQPLAHDEVIETAAQVQNDFIQFVTTILEGLPKNGVVADADV